MSIASPIGHGALGLRDNLLDILSLADQSRSEKHVAVDARLARDVTGWTLDSGSTWVASAAEQFHGIYLDIVRVKTLTETLQRAESLADCQATAGTFYYDSLASPLGLFSWDTLGIGFDQAGVGWDPGLYVHLTGNADPRNTVVVAHYQFCAANRTVVEPSFSRNKLLNGGFETWNSSSDAADWTEETNGLGWSVARESVIVRSGNFSSLARQTGAVSGYAGYKQTTNPSTVVGAVYWLCGAYYTSPDTTDTPQLLVGKADDTQFLTLDGRTLAGASDVVLAPTNGEWRRFAFAFIAPFSALSVRVRFAGAAPGDCYFDDVAFYRVWRDNFYEPLLSEDSVPAVSTGRKSIFYDQQMTGLGSLKLINGSADLETLFGRFVAANQSFVMRYGGRHPGANEILFDNLRIHSNGLGQKPVVTDREAQIELRDTRELFTAKLPRRSHSLSRTPNMDPNMAGHPRVLVLGRITGAPLVRIDKNTSTGFGIYELCDVTDGPNGMVSSGIPGMYVFYNYLDEDSALRRDVNKRKQLVSEDGGVLKNVQVDPVAGTCEVLTDVRVIEVTEANNKIDFNIGGAALVASITPGLYLWGDGNGGSPDTGLLKAIRDAMNAAAGVSNITARYGTVTAYKITIARGSGTLNLLCQTGANKQASLFKTLGFDLGADRTGSLTYTGDNVVFTDPDTDHVFMRADYPGLRDDSSGTYTGSANDPIEKASDILRLILTKMVPTGMALDEPSFLATRLDAPKKLAMFLGCFSNGRKSGSAEEIRTIIKRLETSVTADHVIDGLTHYFTLRDDSAPANIIDLYDRDYHNFRSWLSTDDVYSTVRIAYDGDPATGTWKTIERTESLPTVLYGTVADRTFETWIPSPPTALLAEFSRIASTQRRHFAFGVKGRILELVVGKLVRLNRSRGLVDYTTGVFGPVLARIIRKDDDPTRGWSEIECVAI